MQGLDKLLTLAARQWITIIFTCIDCHEKLKSWNLTFCSLQLGDLSTVIDSSYWHWYRHVAVLLHLILQTRV